MDRRILCCAAVASLSFALVVSAAETLESVEKKLDEQTAKIKTLQYTSRSSSDTDTAGVKSHMVTDLRYEISRSTGKAQFRMESKMKMSQKVGEAPEQSQDMTTLTISDGQFNYSLTKNAQMESAMKTKADGQDPFNTKKQFTDLEKIYKIKVLPDEAVDGKDTFVLELTPIDKAMAAAGVSRMVNYYDKKTGIPLKSVGYDAAGKVSMTSSVTDIKINADIPAERFVFKAPPGVQVMDMTKMGESPASAPSAG